MKSSKTTVRHRQQVLWQKLLANRTVFIEEMALELEVSQLTVRRDLEYLAQNGLVERFHGGARLLPHAVQNDPAMNEDDQLQQTKRLIASRAAQLVEDGDTIFINSSTTAFFLFESLAHKKITIITNNANAIRHVDTGRAEIVFTGGIISSIKHSMVGEIAVQMLKNVRANKCFLGVSGISWNGDISTAVLQETMVNVMMMQQTHQHRVILADSTKIGVQHNFTIGSLDQVSHVVTDRNISDRQKNMFVGQDVELVMAPQVLNL